MLGEYDGVAALSLIACLAVLTVPQISYGQSGPIQLVANNAAANHMISQSAERMELLVKTSRILTLEARIPKFQVHNEEILGATPVSQNQQQIFAKTPGTTELNMWDENDKLYTVSVTVLADAREVWQREYINHVLALNGGNRTKTARDLGVDPRTIFRHLERAEKEG